MRATYFMNNKKGPKNNKKNTRNTGDFKKKQTKKEDDPLVREAIVTEALPNTQFRVRYKIKPEEKDQSDEDSDGYESDESLTYLAGKMVRFRIRILVGDKVSVKTDPYGGKGRVIKRL